MFALTASEFELLIPEIVRKLRAEFGECSVYLFGSRAEGRARPESDIDLVILLPTAGESNAALAGRAYLALRELRAPKDIMVYAAEQFLLRASWQGSFESAVVKKGRLLHAA